RPAAEDEDEPPRKRRAVDEDEDEDEPPRRRRREEEEDEEEEERRPVRKKKRKKRRPSASFELPLGLDVFTIGLAGVVLVGLLFVPLAFASRGLAIIPLLLGFGLGLYGQLWMV